MLYEEIEVGDIVCALTESGDIDVKTLGMVSSKLEKSSYEPMRVICVDHFYDVQNRSGFGCFAPKNLVKLDIKKLYHKIGRAHV